MRSQNKVLLSGMLGNALEIYDFSLYGVFAPLIALKFFPESDPVAALLGSLLIFAVGFFVRPIGAILFGHLGDRFGRKRALTLSISLMIVPTVVMGLLPTYAQIGVMAPVILTLCRLLQGICTGGELTGAVVFAIEHQKKDKAGLTGGLIVMSSSLGALGASLLGALVLNSSNPETLWRLPFLLGVVGALVGFYIRRRLDESPVFQENAQAKKKNRLPLKEVFMSHPGALLRAVGVGGFGTAIAYTITVYTNVYLTNVVGLDLSQSMLFNTLGLLSYLVLSPISGYFSDRYGRGRILVGSAVLALISIYPLFLMLQGGDFFEILCAQVMLGSLAGGFCGSEMGFMNQLFPVSTRYTGVSLGYCLGAALMGGTLPFISTFLINQTGDPLMPAFYLMFCAVVGSVSVAGALRPAKDRSLALQEG